MADNVATQSATLATIPSATTIATDQLAGGEHVQLMKVMDATADGTNRLVVTAAGAAKVDGSAVTQPTSIADGSSVSLGAKADAAWDGAAASPTLIAIQKWIGAKIEAVRALLAGTLKFMEREAGYANVALYAEAVGGIIAETAISINKSLAFAAPAAATSNGASAAKELVIYGILLSWVSTTTTANTCRVRLRVNPAGAAIISSPIAFTMRMSWESATFIANEGELQPFFFPKPIIIPNPGQVMATLACAAANGTLDIQLLAYERTP